MIPEAPRNSIVCPETQQKCDQMCNNCISSKNLPFPVPWYHLLFITTFRSDRQRLLDFALTHRRL